MRVVFLALLLLLCCVSLRLYDRFFSSQLKIIFFDVGQGDAAVVRFPNSRVWLIDSGGGYLGWDQGVRNLFCELTRLGFLTIDRAILSHPDEDHAMGFRSLFEAFRVNEFWFHHRVATRKKTVVRELFIGAEHKQIKKVAVDVPLAGEESEVYWKLLPTQSRKQKSNDEALVLHLSYQGCNVLFTGDLEKEGEAYAGDYFFRPIEILKVAHHGSRTSSNLNWLKQLQPRIAVISSGFRNRYGHPHIEVVEKLRLVGAEVVRTDHQGYVEITIDKSGYYRCESFSGPCGEGSCRLPREK